MSKQWNRCSREIGSLTNELSQMRRELQILQLSVARVVILMRLLYLWMIRMRRLQSNGKTASTIGTHVETTSAQPSPTESPEATQQQLLFVSQTPFRLRRQTPRYRRHVNVTPTVPQETCCRASTAATSCCLVPTLFPCISHVWIAITTQNGLNEPDLHSRNFQSSNGCCKRGGQSYIDGIDDVFLCADDGSNVLRGPCGACVSCGGCSSDDFVCGDFSRESIAQMRQCGTACSTNDGSEWPTQPNVAYSLNQQVTRIDEDGSFFSTHFVETQLFKSKNVFGADAMDI